MKASVKKGKDCKVRMSVEVEAELVEERFQDVMRQFQRIARLPGFRDGKAPLEMVEKRYAEEAREEVLKVLVPEAYHTSVRTQKCQPMTLPAISDIQFERGKKLTFTAEFDEAPEVSLKSYKGIKLRRESAAVTDDDVEKGLQSLLESRGDLVPIVEDRTVRKGDFITADVEVWKEGAYAPGKSGVMLFVEENQNDDFFEKIVGAAINDVREVSQGPSAEEKKQGIVGSKPHYKIWVRGIKTKQLPELNDEFAKGFGKETVEELKTAIRKDLVTYKQSDSMEKMKKELFEKLLAQANFPLPEGVVQRQKEHQIEQMKKQALRMGINEERFESERPSWETDADAKAREQVKLYFILQKVAAAENIDVDEIEIQNRLRGLAEEAGRPIEEVSQMFEEDLRESMKEKKTVDFLLANAKFEEAA